MQEHSEEGGGGANGSHTNLLPEPIWSYSLIVAKPPGTNNCAIVRKQPYNLKQTEESALAQPIW